jgi:hypothetical protein
MTGERKAEASAMSAAQLAYEALVEDQKPE